MESKRKRITRHMLNLLPFGRTATELYDLVSSIQSSQEDLDKQVEEAVEALTRSTDLITNLETSMKERAEKLKKLQQEYDQISELAKITEKQGEAIAIKLKEVVGQNRTRDRIVSFLISIAAGLIIFILGVFMSDWVSNLPSMIMSLFSR